jgi:SMC interacting uncharacterized protein involved in chromosome segregation
MYATVGQLSELRTELTARMNTNQAETNAKIEKIEAKMGANQVETNTKIEKLESKIEKIEAKMETNQAETNSKIEKIEAKMDKLFDIVFKLVDTINGNNDKPN